MIALALAMTTMLTTVRQIERGLPSGHDHTIPNGHSNHNAKI